MLPLLTSRASPRLALSSFYTPVSQDKKLFSLAIRFENKIFSQARNVKDYTNRIHKKLSKVQEVRLPDFFIFDEKGWRRFAAEAS